MLLLLLLSINVLLPGCRQEGCTDPDALNYDITAGKDDGSCIVCKLIQKENTKEVALVDNYSSSPFPFQQVGVFHVTQVKNDYEISSCGEAPERCKLYFTIQNLTNKSMSFQYRLIGNGAVSFSTGYKNVFLPAHQTSPKDSVISGSSSALCGNFNNSFIEIILGNQISYN